MVYLASNGGYQSKGEFSVAEKTADDIFKLIKDEEVEYVDIRFCDLPGVVQHFSIPAAAFDDSVFEDGLAFDGSSVRGFQSIHESDMMLLPDPATARIDPFREAKTLNLNSFVHTPSPVRRTRAIRATWPAKPRTTWPVPASPTPRTS